ncbi:MAG: hypothetical protein IJ639_10155, partial [Ruminococcus sp.]|nr:hypothetical protein [Ruminococcus sp.]
MKYAKRPLSILLSLLLILSLFTIIPATTASAADSDTVSKEVHKWVTGMAVEGNSGFYTFDDLYEKFIFVRVTKGTTFTGWDVVDKQTGDLSLTQMGEHDTYRLTWWDNTQNLDHMAGDWQDTNLSDSHIYLDANDKYGATFSNDAYDWYAYTWETFNLTEHAAVDATCTEAGNIKYYTSGERYFTEDNGTYTQVTQADTVIAAIDHNLTHHAAVTPTYNAGTDTY